MDALLKKLDQRWELTTELNDPEYRYTTVSSYGETATLRKPR